MFDQLKAMGAIAGLMKDKERLRDSVERFREKTARLSVTGEAGGGAVRVTVSGKIQVTAVHLDPALIAGLQTGEGGRALAQTLIEDATNDALTKAQLLVKDELDREARSLGLPAIPGMGSLLGAPD